MTTIIISQNSDFGFYGVMRERANAHQAWCQAFRSIANATQATPETIRLFLDSELGAQFAQGVLLAHDSGLLIEDAVEATTTDWMGWKVAQQAACQYGVRLAAPFLAEMLLYHERLHRSPPQATIINFSRAS